MGAASMLVGQAACQATVSVSRSEGFSSSRSNGFDEVETITGGEAFSQAYNDIEGLSATAQAASNNKAFASGLTAESSSETDVASRAFQSFDLSEVFSSGDFLTSAQSIGPGNAFSVAGADLFDLDAARPSGGFAAAYDEPFA